MQKGINKTSRYLFLGGLLTLPGIIAGCAIGIGALIALAFGGGGGGGEVVLPTISSVKPRESAVVGGVTVTVKGKNFDAGTLVSFGGKAATNVEFVDTQTLSVVVPFNDLGSRGEELRYTDANPTLSIKVVNRSTESVAPFWYMRPRLTSVFEIDGGGQTKETFGHRFERKTVYIRGDFFGFANTQSDTRVELFRQDLPDAIATLTRISTPADPNSVTIPSFWVDTANCDGCATDLSQDPHQGQQIGLRLPIVADVPQKAQQFISGPVYKIRVTNENGSDDVDLGYAPPFPPLGLACAQQGQAVQLTWSDTNPENVDPQGNVQTFNVVFVDRYDPDLGVFVNLATLAGGAQSYTDNTVQNTNYLYRVYGRLQIFVDGQFVTQDSPATACEISVLPEEAEIDMIVNLDIPQILANQNKAGGSDSQKPSSGETLQGLIQGNGRAAFHLRQQRNIDDGTRDYSQFYNTETGKIAITWVTTGNRASFGASEVEALKVILRYHQQVGSFGGVYFEGKHIVSALGAAIQADASGELESLLVQGRFGGFDVRNNIGFYDTINSVEFISSSVDSLQWTTSNRGISSYVEADVKEALAAASGQVVLSGQGSLDQGNQIVGTNVVAAIYTNLPATEDRQNSARSILSQLQLDGFTDTAKQRQMVQRYIDLMDPRAVIDKPGVSSIEPRNVPWNLTTPIIFQGVNLDKVTRVLFGNRDGIIVEKSATTLQVSSPIAGVPGVYQVFLQLGGTPVPATQEKPGDPELVFVGTVTFEAEPVQELSPLMPRNGPLQGGNEVRVTGINFTPTPDLKIFFGTQPAPIISTSEDEVVCLAPPGVIEGRVDVRLVTSAGESMLFYTYGPLAECAEGLVCAEITSISPSNKEGRAFGPDSGGGPNDLISITGLNFTPQAVVYIGGQPLINPVYRRIIGRVNDIEAVQGEVPPGCGIVDISIDNGTAFTIERDRYEYLTPEITDYTFNMRFDPKTNLRDPLQGGSISLAVSNFTLETQVFLDGVRLAESRGNTFLEIPPASPDQIGRELDLEAFNPGSPCPIVTVKFAYAIPVLFLGDFNGEFSDDDPISGASNLKAYFLQNGFFPRVSEESLPGNLFNFAMIFFSDMEGRDLTDDPRGFGEVQRLRSYARSGGVLVLLGQHGIDMSNPVPGGDAVDRNRILAPFGYEFQKDLFADKGDSTHIHYDGCDSSAFGCPAPAQIDSNQGDPDGGHEYPILSPAQQLPPFLDDIFQGTRILFTWGQSLRRVDTKSSDPIGLPVFAGSNNAYLDVAVPFVGPTGNCRDGYFENSNPARPNRPGAIGAVAVDLGLSVNDGGLLLAIGDQEFLLNGFFKDQCPDGSGYTHKLIMDRLIAKLKERLAPR